MSDLQEPTVPSTTSPSGEVVDEEYTADKIIDQPIGTLITHHQSIETNEANGTTQPNGAGQPIGSNEPIGFARGLEADRILGVNGHRGEILFLIRWKGSDIVDIVTASEANVKCPQVVIRFYEDRIQWLNNRSYEELVGLEPESEPEEEEELMVGVNED